MYDLQKRYEDGMKVLLDLKCIDLGKAIQARVKLIIEGPGWGGGGRNLGILGRGFVCSGMPGIFKLYQTYSSVEFCNPILDYYRL